MIRAPDIRKDEGYFLNLNLGQPIPSKGFRRSDAARFQRIISGKIRSGLELASAQGRKDLTIECGELYRSVSKLPVFDPWMIFCCNAMRAKWQRRIV